MIIQYTDKKHFESIKQELGHKINQVEIMFDVSDTINQGLYFENANVLLVSDVLIPSALVPGAIKLIDPATNKPMGFIF